MTQDIRWGHLGNRIIGVAAVAVTVTVRSPLLTASVV